MRYCSRIGWRCMSMGRPCYLHQSLCCSVMRSAHLTQLIVYIGICSCSTSLFEHFSKRLQNMPACNKILARLLCCRKRQAWLVETAMHAGRSAALLTSVIAVSQTHCFCFCSHRVQPEKPASRFARTTNWQLACCNAGVPFSVHSSSSSLQELLQSGAMTQRQGFTFPDAKESTLPPYMEVRRVCY